MKSIDELRNMSLEELERVSLDETAAPSGDIAARSMALIRRQRRGRVVAWTTGVAASLALLIGIGLYTNREPALRDSFSDPYLAYAEVEKALEKIGSAVGSSAGRVSVSKELVDNRLDIVFTNQK